MTEVAVAYVTLLPSTRGWRQKVSNAIGGDAEAAGRDAGGRLGRGLVSGSSQSFTVLSAKFAALAAAYKVFDFAKDSVIGFNSQLQQATIAFTTMLGSADQATKTLADLQQFAKTTPFDFPQLVTASQRLVAYGFSAKQLIPVLTAVGDASAGLGGGAEAVDRITTAIGQINAKGKLQSDELLQLTEAGIPALRILADELGTSTGKLQGLITAGGVTSDVAIPALLKGLEQGTKATAAFGGMMDKQSKTFVGAVSNIKDSLQQTLGKIGKPLFDSIATAAGSLATYLSSPQFTTLGQKLASSLSSGLQAFLGFASQAKTFLAGVFASDTFQTALSSIRSAFGSLIGFVTQSLVPAVQNLWAAFGQDALTAFAGIAQAAAQFAAFLQTTVGPAIQELAGFLSDNKTLIEGIGVALAGATLGWKGYGLAVSLARDAQLGFNKALRALLEAGITGRFFGVVGLIAGALIYAADTSEKFRIALGAAADMLKQEFGTAIGFVVDYLRILVDSFFNAMTGLVTGLDKVAHLVHAPFADEIDRSLADLNNFKNQVDQSMQDFAGRAYDWGTKVGTALATGTANGMERHLADVQAAAQEVARQAQIVSSFNNAIGIKAAVTGPQSANAVENDLAKKAAPFDFNKILGSQGKNLSAASLAGTGLGSSYVEAVKNAITSGVPEMRKATDSLLAAVRTQAAKQGVGSGIVTTVALDNSRLLRLANQRQGIADQLDKANQALSDITSKRDQFRQSTLDTALGSGALTSFVGQNGVGSSYARIAGGLRRAVANMRRLIADVNKLRGEGLSPALLQQIVAAGPDQGLEAAQALLQKGAGGIGEVNKLQQQLTSLSTGFADQNTKQFFSVGVAAAQGIVNGLQSRENLIEAEMQRIAAIMEAAIRRSLGIRSPSRVMRDLFAHVPEGAALGIRDGSGLVASAVADMTSVPTRVPTPQLALTGGRGDFHQTNHISVTSAPNEDAATSLPRAMALNAYTKGYLVV